MSLIITPEQLEQRRRGISAAPDLRALDEHLARDLARVLEKPLYVPEAKAQLSRWGGTCRDDGAELQFDPFSPHGHRCVKCSRVWNTGQTHRWWIYWYQLWLAERVLMMALRGEPAAQQRAVETLAAIVERYDRWPNADNVLGPSRPFFSTYLESIWILQLAAAYSVLDDASRFPAMLREDLRAKLFGSSARLIMDFDEGRSNRQVWNAVALFALGRVLDDEPMQRGAADGIVAAIEQGVLADGLWYEGENYHWFVLRGLAWGAEMMGQAGVADLWTAPGAGERFRVMFRAPVLTALPDFTFPARRDSKFGVSLRQRRMAELWELALARMPETGDRDDVEVCSSLLAHVYDPSIAEGEDDSWRAITEVDRAEAPHGVRREHLGWKAWLWMTPTLPEAPADAWKPGTVHLEATGLAIFRQDEGRTYVSVDYGEPGGGHGHPDRLNLTAVLGGVPWLLDFGTGSYVAPSLAWYRMTLAHNAPMVDAQSQHAAHGSCVAFDEQGGHGWICATLPSDSAYDGASIQRTTVVTPRYTLDVVQLMSEAGSRRLMVPWHGLGELFTDEHGLRFEKGEGTLRVLLAARQPFQVMVQRAPGPPSLAGGEGRELDFALLIGEGEAVTLAACVDSSGTVAELECVEDDFVVRLADGRVHLHRATDEGWIIEPDQGDAVVLEGLREPEEQPAASDDGAEPPAHPLGQPLVLDQARQYRRAEAAYDPGAFSARGRLELDGDLLRVSVAVRANEPRFRGGDDANPEWENENPDIHSDGIQVYLDESGFFGWLIVPDVADESNLRVASVPGTDGDADMIVERSWHPTDDGYAVEFAVVLPDTPSGDFGFDLYVNRLAPGAERRSGQLVWSGARESRLYLAGDRALPGPLPRVKV